MLIIRGILGVEKREVRFFKRSAGIGNTFWLMGIRKTDSNAMWRKYLIEEVGTSRQKVILVMQLLYNLQCNI
jgi:hypothetical protein